MQVKCKSGIMGYRCRLQDNYINKEEWLHYAEHFLLAFRLGYDSAEEAWDNNPVIEGSTIPSDYRKV